MSNQKVNINPDSVTEKLLKKIGLLEYQNAMLTTALEDALANQKEAKEDGDTEQE